jgi:hypothetical protein
MSTSGAGSMMPALFTSRSHLPKRVSVSEKSRSTSAGSLTSPGTASIEPPAIACSFSAERAMIATWAPRSASSSAVRRPMPDDAPVTIATLPSNSPI